MGDTNSKSFINVEPYTFLHERTHEINWRDIKVHIIDDNDKLKLARKALSGRDTIHVDMEGHYFGNEDAKVGLIQVAVSFGCILLFDTVTCPDSLSFIRELVESKKLVKIFHDCSGDISALGVQTGGNVQAANIFDTQVAQRVIDSANNPASFNSTVVYSINELYKKYTESNFPKIKVKYSKKNSTSSSSYGNKWLDQRPLTQNMIKYAAADVLVLPQIHAKQLKQMGKKEIDRCLIETSKKIKSKMLPYEQSFPCASFKKDSDKQLIAMNARVEPQSFSGYSTYQDSDEEIIVPSTSAWNSPYSSSHIVEYESDDESFPSRGSRTCRGGLQQQEEHSALGTALAVGAIAVGVGALALLFAGRERRR